MTFAHKQVHTLSSASACCGVAICAGLLCASSFPAIGQAARGPCGELRNGYGPYDYRTDRDKLPIVEGAHFTPEVEALARSVTGYIGADIDYTLRAFPNHHRALVSMMRYGERTKSAQPPSAQYTIECYFDRAVRFKPDDTTVRMLFATYLHKIGRETDANQQLERAVTLAGENAFTHYNAGLVYLDLKNYDKALRQAHVAYGLGFPRPELREALKATGKWTEPRADLATPSASAAASAAGAAAPVTSEAR